ncbi:MAG: CoA-transferase subunit beta [Acidimicrobiales bacterium]
MTAEATGAEATRAEVCAVACAEAWRGDGEILASAFGTAPAIGARLARATFEPDLVLSDGEAYLVSGVPALGAAFEPGAEPGPGGAVVEGWLPFRRVFDLVWWGRRHVMMAPTQVDRFGNQNISCIGPWDRPKAMLIGARGAPGNTISHPTSYWVANHSPRSFVAAVDMVSGVGYDRVAELGESARFHEIRRVVSNLGVFDFGGPGHAMRLVSVHPGASVADVVAATGFELVLPDAVPETRHPSAEELELIRHVIDPSNLRQAEVDA